MAGKTLTAKYVLDPTGVKTGVTLAEGHLSRLTQGMKGLGSTGSSALSPLGGALGNLAGQFNPLSGVVGGIGAAVDGLGQRLSDLDDKGAGKVQHIGALFGGAGAAAAGAGAGLTLFAAPLKQANDQLSQALTNTGSSWGAYSRQIDEAKSHAAKFASGTEVEGALTTLTTALHSPKEAFKVLGETEDIAATKHISLSKAAEMVGKAHVSAGRLAKSFGDTVDTTKSKNEQYRQLMEEIATQTHGQMAASTNNLRGTFEGLKNKVEDQVQTFGIHYGPAVTAAGAAVGVLGAGMDAGAQIATRFSKAGREAAAAQKAVSTAAKAAGEAAKAGAVGQEILAGGEEAAGVAGDEAAPGILAAVGPIALVVAAVAVLAVGIYELVKHWKAVSKFLGEVWHGIESTAKSVWDGITGFFRKWGMDLLMVFAPVIGIPVFLATHWHKVESDAKAIWGSVIGFFEAIPGKILGFFTGAVKWLDKVGNDILHGLWVGVQNEWTGLGNIGKTILGWFTAGIGVVTKWLDRIGHDILHGMWQGLVDEWTGLGRIGSVIFGWFKAGLGDVSGWLKGFGHTILHGLWVGVQDEWTGLGNVGSTMWGWFTAGIGDATQWLKSTGAAVIHGLAEGIVAAAQTLFGSLPFGIGTKLVNLFKDALGVHSPSVIFHEMGLNLMQGLANGIGAGAGLPLVQLAKVSSAMVGQGLASSAAGIGGGSAARISNSVPGVAGGGPTAVYITVPVTVQGSVSTEKQLGEAIYQRLLEKGVTNGTLWGTNS